MTSTSTGRGPGGSHASTTTPGGTRGGIETKEEFLDGISNQIEQVQTIPGRLVTPVNMASFDTWIKQYRPDENTANMSINYYPKGAVIGFLLDARIRKATNGARSLDTGMQWAMQRYSGEKGYTPEQFYAVMSEVAGTDLKGWFAKTAESTDELDYTEALDITTSIRPDDCETRAPTSAAARATSGRCDQSVGAAHPASTPASTATTRSRDRRCAGTGGGLAARLDQYKRGRRFRCWLRGRDG